MDLPTVFRTAHPRSSPQFFQSAFVSRRIHGLPETGLKECFRLPPGSQALHRLLLKHPAFIMNLTEDGGRKNKEAAVNPAAFALWLFLEVANGGAVDVQAAEPCRRLHGSYRHGFAVLRVKGDRRGNIHVAQAVPVGHAEGIFTRQILSHPFQSSAGARVVAGVDQRDAPRLCNALMHLYILFSRHIEGHVFGHVHEVIVGKVFLDQIALVSATDNEVVYAVLRIYFEDVPKDRPAANLHHRFGAHPGLFAEPCPQKALLPE